MRLTRWVRLARAVPDRIDAYFVPHAESLGDVLVRCDWHQVSFKLFSEGLNFGTILLTWCSIPTTRFSKYTRLVRTILGRDDACFVPHAERLRDFLARFNWHKVFFALFSGGLIFANTLLAIYLTYNCPCGPDGGWPASSVERGTLVGSDFE